jgi:DNA-binding response OmpR family regulator
MTSRHANAVSMAVADPKLDDYASLLGHFAEQQRTLAFVTNGRAALALGAADRWIVNVRLPDMSGFDLCQILNARHAKIGVLLVDETYDPDHELRARSSKAMYVCKPFRTEWCSNWW